MTNDTAPYVGPRLNAPGRFGRCKMCGKAIQLVESRNPDTGKSWRFWVHYAPLVTDAIETHAAVLSPGVADV